MTAGEIALRQEIRQLMAEAGVNRNTIKEMAEQVLKEEIEKRVKQLLDQVNTDAIVQSMIRSFDFKQTLRNTVASEVRDAVQISVDVTACVKQDKGKGEIHTC